MQDFLSFFLVLFIALKVIDIHSLSAIDYVIIALFILNAALSMIKFFTKGDK